MFGMFGNNSSQIDCPEARTLVQQHNAQLVDVRSPQEFARGALPGSVNLPVHAIHGAERHLDRERPVIVYCVSGARSAQAQAVLNQLGFDKVHNLGSIQKYLSC
jgi:phage shock protein E